MRRSKRYSVGFILLVALLYYGLKDGNRTEHTSPSQKAEWNLRDSLTLIAHRGISEYYPENSLAGVEAATQYGFTGAEVDISRSADDSLIVFHDDDGKRLLGVDKDISSFTTAELKQYPIIYHGKKSRSYVMTVSDLLHAKKESQLFYFDMKVSTTRDADQMAKLIRSNGCAGSVIVSSSNIRFAFYLKRNYPDIITCLEGFNAGKEWTYYLMPPKLRPDFYSGFVQRTNARHISWLKKHGLLSRRIVYGVDSTNLEAALKSGFQNIILDYDSSMQFNMKR